MPTLSMLSITCNSRTFCRVTIISGKLCSSMKFFHILFVSSLRNNLNVRFQIHINHNYVVQNMWYRFRSLLIIDVFNKRLNLNNSSYFYHIALPFVQHYKICVRFSVEIFKKQSNFLHK